MHVTQIALWLIGTGLVLAAGRVLWLVYCRWAFKNLPPDVAERAVVSAGRFYPFRRTEPDP